MNLKLDAQAATRTITGDVYFTIRQAIIRCDMMPNTKVNIQSLAKELDASVGAVREALSRLAAEGLVFAEAQRGFTVAPVSADDLDQLTSARIKIESYCIEDSIDNRNLDWETEVVGTLHRLNRTPYVSDQHKLTNAWGEAHRAFHQALVSACSNSWFLRIRNQLYDQSERYRQLSVPLAREERDVNAEHTAISDAVLAGDKKTAGMLIAKHFQITSEIIKESLHQQYG